MFEKFCLPSISAQTNNNFQWIVLFDESTSEGYRSRINEYKEQCKQFLPVFVGEKWHHNFIAVFRGVIKKLCTESGENFDMLLTTYLDNDDALATDFVEDIQTRVVNFSTGTFLNYSTGLQYFPKSKILLRVDYPHNHFISLYEDYDERLFRTVYGYGSHAFIDKLDNVRVSNTYSGARSASNSSLRRSK